MCQTCHANQHQELFGKFCGCPRQTRRRHNRELETRHGFVRNFLNFSNSVATKLTFSFDFLHEVQNLCPQNGYYRRRSTKCHACHPICTSSALDCSPVNQCDSHRKITQQDTSQVLCLPRTITTEVTKVKCCACKCNSCPEDDAKQVRLSVTQIGIPAIIKRYKTAFFNPDLIFLQSGF